MTPELISAGAARRPTKWPHMVTPMMDAGGKANGIMGGMLSRPAVRKILDRRVKKEFASWWVYNVLRGASASAGRRLPNRVTFSGFKGNSPSSLTDLGFEVIPRSFEMEMFSYGYRRETDGYSFVAPKRGLSSVLGGRRVPINEMLGVIAEPHINIPDDKDPSVYRLHPGTRQYFTDAATMEYEARSDAQSTLAYLRAYNDLIKRPTVRNLIKATENPAATGPYFNTMIVAFNNGISPEFMSLLHACFQVHFILEGRFGRSYRYAGIETYQQIDLMLFRAILDRFCRDNYPQARR